MEPVIRPTAPEPIRPPEHGDIPPANSVFHPGSPFGATPPRPPVPVPNLRPSNTPLEPKKEPEPPVFSPHMTAKKEKKPRKWPLLVCLFLIVALLAVAGYLWFMNKTTNDELKTSQTAMLTFKSELDKQNAVDDFVADYNDADLEKSSCGGNALGMFEVHLNDEFAVYKYLCANQSTPVRIAAFQKQSNGTYKFTYSASTTNPMGLPSYIYDSEPEFFGGDFGALKF